MPLLLLDAGGRRPRGRPRQPAAAAAAPEDSVSRKRAGSRLSAPGNEKPPWLSRRPPPRPGFSVTQAARVTRGPTSEARADPDSPGSLPSLPPFPAQPLPRRLPLRTEALLPPPPPPTPSGPLDWAVGLRIPPLALGFQGARDKRRGGGGGGGGELRKGRRRFCPPFPPPLLFPSLALSPGCLGRLAAACRPPAAMARLGRKENEETLIEMGQANDGKARCLPAVAKVGGGGPPGLPGRISRGLRPKGPAVPRALRPPRARSPSPGAERPGLRRNLGSSARAGGGAGCS